MTDKQTPQSAGLSLGDIYFVLFRHKWKIIFFSIAGIATGVTIYLLQSPLYQSTAKLYIPYVQEVKPLTAPGGSSVSTTESDRGGNIIATEVQILTSLDLANEVVDVIGAEKILAKTGGGNDRNQAAAAIRGGIDIDAPKDSSVIQITFRYPDPSIVQTVLSQLIGSYQKKHVDIHRNWRIYDNDLTRKVDALRTQLAQTEAQLKEAESKVVGGVPLEVTQKGYAELITRVQDQQFDTVTELAVLQARLAGLEAVLPTRSTSTNSEPVVPKSKLNEYKGIITRLDALSQQEFDLKIKYAEESNPVKNIQEQIAAAEERKSKLEEEFPELTEMRVTPQSQTADTTIYNQIGELSMQILAYRARTNTLANQLQEVIADANNLSDLAAPINSFQRTKDLQEKQFTYYLTTLENARWDEEINSGKASNISVAQEPSPPFKSPSKVKKPIAMSVVGGVGGGIGLAFLLEMFLSRTLKRPLEVEARLKLPVILSIPRIKGIHKLLPSGGGRNGQKLLQEYGEENGSDSKAVATVNGDAEVQPWDANHRLRPFYEGLRDRLMTDFENRKLTHNPKLVAVTSCSKGSGVTSIAAGLAATLSETGDGNVLLVDMNPANGSVHPFFRGKPSCGLAELLDDPNNDTAMVQENLYMASGETNKDKLQRILPRRFTNLVPKLKASDYDYIIFDMPPISQTSVTPRLSGYMDTVLLVIESEKTDKEVARRATELLGESKAHVNLVLNKTRKYVPAQLHQEFLDGV